MFKDIRRTKIYKIKTSRNVTNFSNFIFSILHSEYSEFNSNGKFFRDVSIFLKHGGTLRTDLTALKLKTKLLKQ